MFLFSKRISADLDVYLIDLFGHVASEKVLSILVSKASENKIRNVLCSFPYISIIPFICGGGFGKCIMYTYLAYQSAYFPFKIKLSVSFKIV